MSYASEYARDAKALMAQALRWPEAAELAWRFGRWAVEERRIEDARDDPGCTCSEGPSPSLHDDSCRKCGRQV